jgi:DeoR family transcriptional regulator of aga operon
MKTPIHVVKARRARLARLLADQRLSLEEICQRLDISVATARRDLAALEAERAITRSRGRAIYDYGERFPSHGERLIQNYAGKQQIAEAARAMIEPGHVVWMDSGTTTHAVAHAIARQPIEGLTVVTNNIALAETLAEVEDVAVHLSGGQYFRRNALLVAGKVLDGLQAWKFDLALMSAQGIAKDGLYNSILAIVALQQRVRALARRTVFCIDSTKLGKRAPELLMPLSEIEHLVTDATPEALCEHQIRLPRRKLTSVPVK